MKARSHVSKRGQEGFTLAELMLAVLLSGLLGAVLLAALLTYQRVLLPGSVLLDGRVMAVAPSFAPFPAAVNLHRVLTARLSTAVAVYVFGGRHQGLPEGLSTSDGGPLVLEGLPSVPAFTPGLPMDSGSFYEVYAAQLGARRAAAGAQDFSVVVVGRLGEELAVVGFLQSESRDVEEVPGERGALRRHRVRMWDAEEGALAYEFAEPLAGGGLGQYSGAVHTWYRHDAAGGVFEEGPACVVFADPWLWAGSRGDAGEAPAFSRFSNLMAVNP
jgi:hypothetical protein